MYEICRQDIIEWALLPDALISLYFGVCLSMAGMTEGNQVREMVSTFIVVTKSAIGYLMMHSKGLTIFIEALYFGQPTFLTGIIIPLESFAFLSLPVWAVVISRTAIDIQRMIKTDSMLVTASATAIFTRSSTVIYKSRRYVKLIMTIEAFIKDTRLWPVALAFALAFSRAVFASPKAQARFIYLEGVTAIFTDDFYSTGTKALIVGWLSLHAQVSTIEATIFSILSPIRFNLKWVFAG